MSNSSTTTETDLIEPIHPGEILMEDSSRASGSRSMNLQSNYELWLERRVLRDKVAAFTPLQVA